MPRTICLDLDGVIKEYHGEVYDEIVELLPGAVDAIKRFLDHGFEVVVCTARDDTAKWAGLLSTAVGSSIKVTNEKPPAVIYVDDRAYKFNGAWSEAVCDDIEQDIKRGPWWKQPAC